MTSARPKSIDKGARPLTGFGVNNLCAQRRRDDELTHDDDDDDEVSAHITLSASRTGNADADEASAAAATLVDDKSPLLSPPLVVAVGADDVVVAAAAINALVSSYAGTPALDTVIAAVDDVDNDADDVVSLCKRRFWTNNTAFQRCAPAVERCRRQSKRRALSNNDSVGANKQREPRFQTGANVIGRTTTR